MPSGLITSPGPGNFGQGFRVQAGMDDSVVAWARTEFGHCCLGDERRSARLLQMAAAAASRPSGTITGTFKLAADREGAFRFVENDDIDPSAIGAAVYEAAAKRSATERVIVVPVDETSLCLRDPEGQRGFGPVGSYHRMATGIQVMSALAVKRDGSTIGLLDQEWWVRGWGRIRRPKGGSKADPRPPEERETYYWVRTLRAAAARMSQHAPGCIPWFQLDRGGDCRAVFEFAQDERIALTVRAKTDRRLHFRDGKIGYLYAALDARPLAGYYEVAVPARPGQRARTARLAVRFLAAPIALPLSKKRRRVVTVHAVLAREVDPPVGQEAIRWVLLTSRRVGNLVDALQIVSAYTLRWRIEDFHKVWKSGACDIEGSQLRRRDHFQRWATIMAAVAARIERIKHLSRTEPTRPATDEFTQDEIDALILLRSEGTTVPYEVGDVPSLGEATRWIADLGGYMGSRNSPPPGSKVLRRGLEQVTAAAAAVRALRVTHGRSGQS